MYSSAESVGSYSPDSNKLLDRESALHDVAQRKTIQAKEHNDHVSILNVVNESKKNVDV